MILSFYSVIAGWAFGYAFEEKNSLHRILWDGLKYYTKYNKPVYLFGYVQNPTSETLMSDRKACKEHFDYFIKRLFINQIKISK